MLTCRSRVSAASQPVRSVAKIVRQLGWINQLGAMSQVSLNTHALWLTRFHEAPSSRACGPAILDTAAGRRRACDRTTPFTQIARRRWRNLAEAGLAFDPVAGMNAMSPLHSTFLDKAGQYDKIRHPEKAMANRTQTHRILTSAALALFLTGARAEAQSAHYKDGEFTGDPVEVLWGIVQVKAVIQSGKITDVQFLQMPFDRTRSVEITDLSKPLLESEAIKAQSAQVDLVSSATMTSIGFRQTLASALAKAKK
jgi:uncharacterized protein with FMN-binding domain